MSQNWVQDIANMHEKFGVYDWLEDNANNTETLKKLLQFRLNFITEEYNETLNAYKNNDTEELIDGLIDLCVVAIGTLDILGVNTEKSWNEVLRANMSKIPGIKPSRPNPLGLPDLIKPEGWKGPDHSENYGELLPKIFSS